MGVFALLRGAGGWGILWQSQELFLGFFTEFSIDDDAFFMKIKDGEKKRKSPWQSLQPSTSIHEDSLEILLILLQEFLRRSRTLSHS